MQPIFSIDGNRLFILAENIGKASEIAKNNRYTIDDKSQLQEVHHIAAPASLAGPAPASAPTTVVTVSQQDINENDTDQSSPANELGPITDRELNEPKLGKMPDEESASDTTITQSPAPIDAPKQVAKLNAGPATDNKKRKSNEVQELTMDLVYSHRNGAFETSGKWAFTQQRAWKQTADANLDLMGRIENLVKEKTEDIRLMAGFLVAHGLTQGAYVTSNTSSDGNSIQNGPTLDCVKSDPIVLLYTDKRSKQEYRTIRTNGNDSDVEPGSQAMIAFTTGSIPNTAMYKKYSLDNDAVEYVSSYYRPTGNTKIRELTQDQKYMVFLLVVKSGWGRYSRDQAVWIDGESVRIADTERDIPNLVFVDGKKGKKEQKLDIVDKEATTLDGNKTSESKATKKPASKTKAAKALEGVQPKAQKAQASSDIIQSATIKKGKITFEGKGWFNATFGFDEKGFEKTKGAFTYDESNGILKKGPKQQWQAGKFETTSLGELRKQYSKQKKGRVITPTFVTGNVAVLHDEKEYNGAVFQAASQFNCLEFTNEKKTPDDGIAEYVHDPTQGPACAMACAPGTIVRNYFKQTTEDQINTLDDAIKILSGPKGTQSDQLVTVRNGYAESTKENLEKLNKELEDDKKREEAKRRIKVGIQRGTVVTCTQDDNKNWRKAKSENVVTQVYVSAIPLGQYMSEGTTNELWTPLAKMVLEAAYEATLLVAADLKKKAVLTYVGNGVFDNEDKWIAEAIKKALGELKGSGLEVVINEYTEDQTMRELIGYS
jgi:hypothetical protein